jgi:hypothetical protein
VTSAELLPLVEQNRAGLDAALMLLHRLQAIAVDQRRASETGSTTQMQATLDHRDRVIGDARHVERELKGVRQSPSSIARRPISLPTSWRSIRIRCRHSRTPSRQGIWPRPPVPHAS